jgi:NAD-dependent dihydropyrimidine dehydrogenase PreA subunit/flavodoxin
MNNKIHEMYFSATGTTKKVVSGIANKISQNIYGETNINIIDFTLPKARIEAVSFGQDDIVIIGVPVYAGRVPNVLLKFLNSIMGNGALAIPIVVYGNRNYDDALIELKDILIINGFKVIASAAFVGEHSFSTVLAKNRPDEKDMEIASSFADQIYKSIATKYKNETINLEVTKVYRNYYTPKDKEGKPVDIRKVKPKTNSNCIDCKLCVNICPMGSIDWDDVSKFNGICIKCGACVKKCPTKAKFYDDKDYLRHKLELEIEFSRRKEAELFI